VTDFALWEFAGTREASCVTDLLFLGICGHAGDFLRDRFVLLGEFRAGGFLRDRFVILGSLWAGENSYGHVYPLLTCHRVRKTFSRTR
jgi:hypothetical protein